eukprot:3921637-Alexandrium_andersonii.AAC.1
MYGWSASAAVAKRSRGRARRAASKPGHCWSTRSALKLWSGLRKERLKALQRVVKLLDGLRAVRGQPT